MVVALVAIAAVLGVENDPGEIQAAKGDIELNKGRKPFRWR